MFYPADCLKRGGKFYLLWVADSWPQHFASIKDHQIWSQDIRKLCDDLNHLIVSESGRPSHRYSLRLSSQLMRGLVRLYYRKAQSLLRDLCMIEAKVISKSNKRVTTDEEDSDNERARPRARAHKRITAQPKETQRLGQPIEEILQNSGNVVANIQDITLREPIVNEPVQPPNEGFGEENLEQALQFLSSRRSVEQMMVPSEPATCHSALELPLDTDKSHDRTRLAPTGRDMERISGHDLTILRPSDGGMLSTTDVGKDISEIPDIPILPIPEMPDSRKKQSQEVVELSEPAANKSKKVSLTRQSTQIELEELEELEPRPRRRRKLIRDKVTQLDSDFIRSRIRDPHVDIRVKEPSELVVQLKVPFEVFVNRPCHAGFKERSNIAQTITRIFMRNLGIGKRFAHQQFEEEELRRPLEYHTRSTLNNIAEVEERALPELQVERPQEISAVVNDNLAPPEIDISNRDNVTEQQDIADMPTQKLELIRMSQQKETGKRSSQETTASSKRQKTASDVPLRENQPRLRESEDMLARPEREMVAEVDMDVDKENIAANQQARGFVRISIKQDEGRRITALLQEAGLSDVPPAPTVDTEQTAPQAKQSGRKGSESSESLLGSLDRTKVSLGDSVKTTESMKVIKDQWGTEGTMMKIIKCIGARRDGETVTINNIVAQGPVFSEYKNIIIAKCFSSILKLKQHGFIKVQKCPETLEILDIMVGPKITSFIQI